MNLIEKAECDRCGIKARILADGAYAKHGYTQYGVRTECEYSGKKYARHTGSFRVTERDSNNIATEWVCNCRCGKVWLGPDHESVEQPWVAHVEAVKAVAA